MTLISIALGLCLLFGSCEENGKTSANDADQQPKLGYRTTKILEVDGLQFKDLNRNGQLDPYEDWRLTSEVRSKDLVSKMSLEQKAGFMLYFSSCELR